MSYTYKFTPKRKGYLHVIIPLGLFVAGMVLILFSGYPNYPGSRIPLQLLSVLCISVGIAIASRFSVFSYDYTLSYDEKGTLWMVVCRIGSNRSRTTVFTSPVSGHQAVFFSEKEYNGSAFKGNPLISFCMNIACKNCAYIIFDTSYAAVMSAATFFRQPTEGYITLKIECDHEFRQTLENLFLK